MCCKALIKVLLQLDVFIEFLARVPCYAKLSCPLRVSTVSATVIHPVLIRALKLELLQCSAENLQSGLGLAWLWSSINDYVSASV